MTKIKRQGIIALILLIAIPLALAVSVSVKWTANLDNFNGVVYHCTDSGCSNVDNKLLELNSGSDNFIMTNFNAPDGLTDYHAAYFSKLCYVPNEFIISTLGDIDYNTAKDVVFGKKTGCQAEIDSTDFIFSGFEDVFGNVGSQFSIVVPVKSAFSGRNGAVGTPGFIPDDLKDDYYSSLVRVSVNVEDSHGVRVFTESKDVKILVDDEKNVVFNWIPEQTGNYLITMKTSVIDCKCSSTRDDQIQKFVFVKQGTGSTTTTTTVTTTTTILGSTTTIPGSTTTTTLSTTTTVSGGGGGGGGSGGGGSNDVFFLDDVRLDKYSIMPGEKIEITVDLRKDVSRTLRGIAIKVNIPGLGISTTSDEFELKDKEEMEQFEVAIPGDAEPGDYVMDVIVFNDDRTLDRYVKFTVFGETVQVGTSTTSVSGLEGITGSAVDIPDTGSLLNSGLFRIGLMAVLTMVIFYIIWRI